MIAKRINRKASKTSNYGRLARYIAAENIQGKCIDMWAANCLSSPPDTPLDVDMVISEVTGCQNRYTGSGEELTYHLLLSFPSDERPSNEDIHEIETKFADCLGFGEHQRLVAVHDNTDNFHVHLAINKVHPETRKVHTPFRDFRLLEQQRLSIERDYGLQPNPERSNTLRSTQAQDKEAHSHEASMERYLREEKAMILSACEGSKSWSEFHNTLKDHGLMIKHRGRGLVIGDGKVWVKASTVDRELSMGKLEKRFGSFMPSIDTEKTWREKATELFQTHSECATKALAAESWQQVHTLLGQENMAIKQNGRSLMVGIKHEGNYLWKQASILNASLTRGRLEKRLGSFEKNPLLDVDQGNVSTWQQRSPVVWPRSGRKTQSHLRALWRACLESPAPSWKAYLQQQSQHDPLVKGYIQGNRIASGWVRSLDKMITSLRPRTYLSVPMNEREAVKLAGGRWDSQEKAWYLPNGGNRQKVKQWQSREPAAQAIDLVVPFSQSKEAKAIGAKWDSSRKVWQLPRGGDISKARQWIPIQRSSQEIDLFVPKNDREGLSVVRSAGAKWHEDKRCWYLPKGHDQAKVSQWIIKELAIQDVVLRVISKKDREQAKEAGALWNRKDRQWYLPKGGDLGRVSQWIACKQKVSSHGRVVNDHNVK